MEMLFFFQTNYRSLGSLFMVRMQRVQIFTVLCDPFISIRRRCTFKMKRRRVRCCECGTLLPYIGFRSQMSQRPAAILLILSLLDYQQGLWYFQSQIKEPNIMPIPMTQYTFYLVVRV